GISSLETTFPVAVKALGRRTNLGKLIEKISITPRKIFGLPVPTIDRGKEAEITIFTPDGNTTLETNNMKSRSKNNPFLGTILPGMVLGVISKNRMVRFA
ncbi:MAG: hypothetical protein OEQ53_22785, partial [Saprospiraceae bacterium]|nr:hypothetical protein [Saprospiraceae bacterium]